MSVAFICCCIANHRTAGGMKVAPIGVKKTTCARASAMCVVRVVAQMGFALAFLALLKGSDGYNTLFQSMVEVFRMSMGDISLPFSDDA